LPRLFSLVGEINGSVYGANINSTLLLESNTEGKEVILTEVKCMIHSFSRICIQTLARTI
jgi:hypothetical protein